MYRVTIIGSGNMAGEYVRVIQNIGNFKINGIVTRKVSSYKKLAQKINYKVKRLKISDLTQIRSDLIIVAISEENIFKILKQISNVKSIILCEKPIGLNYSEFSKILKLFEIKNTKLFVALNRRYYQSMNMLKKLIEINSIGRINIVDQQDQNLMKKNGKNEKVIKYLMYANSVHLIDLINFFSLNSSYKILKKKIIRSSKTKIIECEIKTHRIIFKYKCYWNIKKRWEIKAFGRNKIYRLKPTEKIFVSKNNSKKKYNEIEISKIDQKFKPGIYFLMKDILKYLKNRKLNNLITIQNHKPTVKLINDIYEK